MALVVVTDRNESSNARIKPPARRAGGPDLSLLAARPLSDVVLAFLDREPKYSSSPTGHSRRAYSSAVTSLSLPRAILGPGAERLSSRADVVSGRIE
jgi:hypothetical protein